MATPHLRLLPPAAAELQLLTVTEAGELLRCSRWTIRRRVVAGELEATGEGTLTRITLASVRAYLERHTQRRKGSRHAS